MLGDEGKKLNPLGYVGSNIPWGSPSFMVGGDGEAIKKVFKAKQPGGLIICCRMILGEEESV